MPLLPPEHDPHVGDIGTAFRGTAVDTDSAGNRTVVPITGGTVTWRFQRPDGSTYDRAASIVDGPNGLFEYVTVLGDIDAAGPWKRQALVQLAGGGSWWTNVIAYDVEDVLAVPVP